MSMTDKKKHVKSEALIQELDKSKSVKNMVPLPPIINKNHKVNSSINIKEKVLKPYNLVNSLEQKIGIVPEVVA